MKELVPWYVVWDTPPQIRLAANGRTLTGPDGTALVGPCAITHRPPEGVGDTLHLPGFCRLYGMDPPRSVRVLRTDGATYWWWEGDLPGGTREAAQGCQTRFDM